MINSIRTVGFRHEVWVDHGFASVLMHMHEVVQAGLGCRKGSAFSTWFVSSAVGILTVTGLAKVWTAVGPTKVLATADPVTGISFQHLMLVVGLLELLIAGICLFGKAEKVSLASIAWLATSFSGYRLGLWWIGWHRPCGCLGNLTDALHVSPHLADSMMKGILAYLLIGSYGILSWQWRQRQQARLQVLS